MNALRAVSAGQKAVAFGFGDLTFALLTLHGQPTLCIGFNYEAQLGSIGVREAAQLVRAFQTARTSQWRVVLLLESAGIRVTDGTTGIASLRKILREALDAKLDGVRMLAVVFKATFGGASMLAALCERTLIHPDSLYAMSGPKLITDSVSIQRFDTTRKDMIQALMGGVARAQASDHFYLLDSQPDTCKNAILKWLDSRHPDQATIASLWTKNIALEQRLPQSIRNDRPKHAANGAIALNPISNTLQTLFPDGYTLHERNNIGIANSSAQPETRVLILQNQQGTGARQALALAVALLHPATSGSHTLRKTWLLLDSPGHAATPEDEFVVLSEILAHLSLVVRLLQRYGQAIHVIVTGTSGGGIQAALGSAATSVLMTCNARLLVLPPAALRALNKGQNVTEGGYREAIAATAIDSFFQSNLPVNGV